MATSQHLEEELGRLSGQLQALAPTLESIDKSERENSNQLSTLRERVEGIRREFDQMVSKVSARLGSLYTRIGAVETDLARQKDRLSVIETESRSANFGTRTGSLENQYALQAARIKLLEDAKDGIGKKAWDIGKILITAAVAAFATWYIGRK